MYRSLWSAPLFRIFGIRVRADLFLLIFVAVEMLRALPRGSAYVEASAAAMAILFASVLLHELGHCAAARRMGGGAEEIVLWPLGGIASVHAPRTPRAQFWTTFGGPAVNLLLAAALGGFLLARGNLHQKDLLGDWQTSWLLNAFRVNLALLLFNLLPAFPMDGGQMLRALLWTRMGFGGATILAVRVGKVAAILLAVAGLAMNAWLLVAVAVMNFIACEQERMLLGAGEIGEEASFLPELSRVEEEARSAGWFSRRRQARREREILELREREARLRARVDAILDKINRVGMQGLTRDEHATLKEASDVFKHSRP